jgi:hypothetical protein
MYAHMQEQGHNEKSGTYVEPVLYFGTKLLAHPCTISGAALNQIQQHRAPYQSLIRKYASKQPFRQ